MASFKKLKDLSGLNLKAHDNLSDIDDLEKQSYRGVAGNAMVEPVPKYNSTPSERVYKNDNNAWIVLGRDRPANRFSGYSGKGATGAGSVDIVAGRASIEPRDTDEDGNELYVDPNFKTDAARLHLSQKTDIDDNFDLVDGNVGNSVGKSGLGAKADSVRIVGREGIKLVTGTDSVNSQGGSVGTIKGIDLIAGNSDNDLQPLVKGDNLTDAIERIIEHQKSLTGMFETFLTAQMAFNSAVASHGHPVVTSPTFQAVTSPVLSSAGIASTTSELVNSFLSSPSHRINLESFKLNYCNPIGKKYINSRHNNTN